MSSSPLLQTMAFSLSAAWLSIIGLIILGDVVVSSEHLKRSSLDGQLIRLGARLIGVVFAIVFLIRGADELGFPAYSVLAGLGVGGLAVALAARDSIANLLGSLLIMFEKPFRIGHYIRVGGSEGTVEDVGFRSTRIRTPDNSLISIPNNAVVNTTVENLSLRAMRRQRFFVQVTYDTPREKVEALVAGIRRLILDHPLTNKTNFQVRFNNFSESSLDILVMFYFDVRTTASSSGSARRYSCRSWTLRTSSASSSRFRRKRFKSLRPQLRQLRMLPSHSHRAIDA